MKRFSFGCCEIDFFALGEGFNEFIADIWISGTYKTTPL